YPAFEALKPYFDLVQKGLRGLVDSEHYFNTVADDAFFEFLYDFPGWPRTIRAWANSPLGNLRHACAMLGWYVLIRCSSLGAYQRQEDSHSYYEAPMAP